MITSLLYFLAKHLLAKDVVDSYKHKKMFFLLGYKSDYTHAGIEVNNVAYHYSFARDNNVVADSVTKLTPIAVLPERANPPFFKILSGYQIGYDSQLMDILNWVYSIRDETLSTKRPVKMTQVR